MGMIPVQCLALALQAFQGPGLDLGLEIQLGRATPTNERRGSQSTFV